MTTGRRSRLDASAVPIEMPADLLAASSCDARSSHCQTVILRSPSASKKPLGKAASRGIS